MWRQVEEPDGVIWAFAPPSKPWGFVQGTYTRPNHSKGYTLNEPGLVAKGEMILAIEHQPGINLWEHYERREDGFWWPCSGHDMGALLCDPDFVQCIKNMGLTLEHGEQRCRPRQYIQNDMVFELSAGPAVPILRAVMPEAKRRGGKQRKGRNWWNK